MYCNVVLDLDGHGFEEILEEHKERKGYVLDTDLLADDWKGVIERYKSKVLAETGQPFPQDPLVQLWGAIGAVFSSWMNNRAKTYRRLNAIPESWGTAVTVQAMVFGNMGETSATGVAFTRDPSTGANALYGEFLVNAQGEDVVAGIRTPQNITEAARIGAVSDKPSLETVMPAVFKSFVETTHLLERHYRDMQDMEFTVERGKLWMLQTRNGKRTTKAALKIAIDMANEGLITREEAIGRIDPASLDQLLHPTLDPKAARNLVAIRPSGLARRRPGRDRVHLRRRRERQGGRPQDHPGPGRDLARGHQRHARRRRHPDDARRHDVPCGRRGARHGQALRFGRGLHPGRLRGPHDDELAAWCSSRATSSRSTDPPARC